MIETSLFSIKKSGCEENNRFVFEDALYFLASRYSFRFEVSVCKTNVELDVA